MSLRLISKHLYGTYYSDTNVVHYYQLHTETQFLEVVAGCDIQHYLCSLSPLGRTVCDLTVKDSDKRLFDES